MAFSEARRLGFSPATPVSSPPLPVNGFSQYIKAQINAIVRTNKQTNKQNKQTNLNFKPFLKHHIEV